VEEAARPPSPEPARPQPGGFTITRADVACLGPLIALAVYAWASIPLGPWLIGPHPVLLSALRGSISSLIASGAKGPIWLSMVAPIPIMVAADPFYYWAGRRYGRRILEYYAGQSPRWQRRVARGERFFARWGAWTIAFGYFLPVPNALFYIAAGESRMPIPLFAAADAVGTLSWIGLLASLGWALGSRATSVADNISHYGLWLTGALVILVVGFAVARGVRTARSMGE
jgi:membrane protein DedA with SNARE-associated domain